MWVPAWPHTGTSLPIEQSGIPSAWLHYMIPHRRLPSPYSHLCTGSALLRLRTRTFPLRDISRLQLLHCDLGDEEEQDDDEHASGIGGGGTLSGTGAGASGQQGAAECADDAQPDASSSGRRGGDEALHEPPLRLLSLGDMSEQQRSRTLGRCI